jgi:quinol monooxygenase YgiN
MPVAREGPRDARGSALAITKVVTLTVSPEHESKLDDLARRLVDHVYANEPGTLLYVVTKHPSRPHTYVWVERYRDEAALQTHTEQPYVEDAVRRVSSWWVAEPAVLQLAQVAPR